jgi:hypothetical protein
VSDARLVEALKLQASDGARHGRRRKRWSTNARPGKMESRLFSLCNWAVSGKED